jgi:hypothetical protein
MKNFKHTVFITVFSIGVIFSQTVNKKILENTQN